MSMQAQPALVRQQSAEPAWSPVTRVAFRFGVAYLGLFCLSTQIITSLFSPTQGEDIPDPGTLWPLRPIVLWTARHVFRASAPLSMDGNSASGDSMYGWVLAFCLLVIAATATVIWSILDRRRTEYTTLQKWVRLFIRFALAGQMLNYGLAKVVPVQMPYPSLRRLVQPFGTFSPMSVLWSSIGASSAYEVFAGCAEVFGGILLIVPRTAAIGAVVCLADMLQVFMLNMTYDVPVKLFAFHLILLSVFLLAPDLPRLANLLVLNRPVTPRSSVPLFRSMRTNRIALVAQLAVGIWLIGMNVHLYRHAWFQYGGGRPQPELYGIWDVKQMSIDHQTRPALLTDEARWRRAIFDVPGVMAEQSMGDTFSYFNVTVNADHALELTRADDKDWKAILTFQRPARDRLIMDGQMAGRPVHLELQLVDRNQFPLVNRGFHLIQESAYQR